MNAAINLLSVIPMRKEASHRSEMVSQLLFGEYVQILEEEDHFLRVKCLYDDYEGWVQSNQLTHVTEVLSTDTYVGVWTGEVFINDCAEQVPMCSPVYQPASHALNFNGTEVRYSLGEGRIWKSCGGDISSSSLLEIYNKFMHTPYL